MPAEFVMEPVDAIVNGLSLAERTLPVVIVPVRVVILFSARLSCPSTTGWRAREYRTIARRHGSRIVVNAMQTGGSAERRTGAQAPPLRRPRPRVRNRKLPLRARPVKRYPARLAYWRGGDVDHGGRENAAGVVDQRLRLPSRRLAASRCAGRWPAACRALR